VRSAASIPVLRKEFIVDAYQIYEARAFGADIILLIVAALNDRELIEFSNLAHSLGMKVLIEVHDAEEIIRVRELAEKGDLGIDLLGINARNLKTLEISTSEEVGALSAAGASGILVGEALVKDGNPTGTIQDFINRAESERVRRL
jgi:indole-3-glycerol phosphate synthase